MSSVETPLDSLIGTRVVRGPDWDWGEQDGGDGHVGTLRKCKNSKEVVVVWDHGIAANYRCNSSHDLRILDSAPAGIKHQNIRCNICNAVPIYGTRWKCSVCDDYDLCSGCYHGDKHSLQHKFYCIDMEGRQRLVEARGKSRKIPAYGLFPGACVTRGVDYEVGLQDLLVPRASGKIRNTEDWNSSKPRSAVFVEWELGIDSKYRVGFEGKVDIKATTKARGYSFYRDHLPVLGKSVCSNRLAVGSRVKIELDLEAVQLLQLDYDGWNDKMTETLSCSGTVIGYGNNHAVVVQYPSGKRWRLNPAALTLLNGETADKCSFKVGDFVRISDDLERVKTLQRGHGEWVDSMLPALGKVGQIKEILSDRIKVNVAAQNLFFNPACVVKSDATMQDLTENFLSGLLMQLLESNISSSPKEDLIKAAAKNDVEKIQRLLSNNSVQVNDDFNGITALLAASFHKSVEAVRLLIQHGANLESKDKDGDRAVHNAASRDEPEILLLLAEAGADLNSRNDKKQSPLHIAVANGHIRAVTCLLILKAQPSLQDFAGDSPLHDAITKGKDDIVKQLVESKADITVRNMRGFNCLHHAALLGNAGAMNSLIAKMPDRQIINEKKEDGFTALHLASLNGHLEGAEVLIHKGKAEIDARNNNLQTALHLAIQGQHMQLVQLLVEKGASLDIKDKDGNSPMHEAVRYHTFLQIKKLQEVADTLKALVGSELPAGDSNTSAPIACLLAAHGADLTLQNNANQTPLDLCIDPKLSKDIGEWHVPNRRPAVVPEPPRTARFSENPRPTIAPEIYRGASAPKTLRRSIVSEASRGPIAPEIYRAETVPEIYKAEIAPEIPRRPIPEIYKAEIVPETPRRPIVPANPGRSIVPEIPRAGMISISLRGSGNVSNVPDTSNVNSDEVKRLTEQLNKMREQMLCPICMDCNTNMAFMCGHGTCQVCSERVTDCPICRTPIERRVLLFLS